jgi:hypothetical protein
MNMGRLPVVKIELVVIDRDTSKSRGNDACESVALKRERTIVEANVDAEESDKSEGEKKKMKDKGEPASADAD